MTNTPGMMPNDGADLAVDRLVLFLAYPDMGLLDATGPQTAFWAASEPCRRRGMQGYERPVVSLRGGLIRTAEGVELQTRPVAAFAGRQVDTIVVPGSPHMEQVIDRSDRLVDWLRHAAMTSRRTVSVCSGAFLLAKAGLLDGKRAATHWGMCDSLAARFPAVDVERDPIFLQQGSVWTSAGVTAGIDLALALIENDCGHGVAMDVARELVVYLKRPGGQSQFSELLQSQAQQGGTFDALNLWIIEHLDRRDLSVDLLAEQAHMSPRNFARVYKAQTGRTPAKAVEVFRLEAARRLLEDSHLRIDQIAVRCGLGDEERLRVTFQRHMGVAPRDYRRRFAA